MHKIRLRSAWTVDAPNSQKSCRNLLPLSLNDLVDERGERVLLTRSFHRPTGLDGQRVFLFVEVSGCQSEVLLNGVQLGTIGLAGGDSFDVTDRLVDQNRLQIAACSSAADAAIEAVELHIDDAGS